MNAKLFRSGGGVALTIPREVAQRYHLGPGVEVEISPGDDGILLKPVGVPPWFSFEWERALDGVVERYKTALEMIHEAS